MMLSAGGFYYDELISYQQNELSAEVFGAQEEALQRCTAGGEDWENVWDAENRAANVYAARDKCDHWRWAWHTDKSEEHEIAEELNWEVAGHFLDWFN